MCLFSSLEQHGRHCRELLRQVGVRYNVQNSLLLNYIQLTTTLASFEVNKRKAGVVVKSLTGPEGGFCSRRECSFCA